MGKVYGYIRVSTDMQTVDNQELAIRQHCDKLELRVDDWYRVEMSSRRTTKQRRIDELLDTLAKGDTLIVSELSRLARSVGQIAMMVDQMLDAGVRIICIKEGMDLNGKRDIKSKVMITMFSLFAEIERDLISERTKEGLARARAQGKLLGRPKGSLGKSQLDGKEKEIQGLLDKKVSKASIAKIYGVTWPTMDHFIKTRGLRYVGGVPQLTRSTR